MDGETPAQALVRDILYGRERTGILGYDRGTGEPIPASPLYAKLLAEVRERSNL